MSSLQITIMLNSGSLILGVGAWLFAIFAIATNKVITAHRHTALSFSFCAFALVFQLFEINNRVNIGDYSAIEDTIRAVLLASVTLIATTIALNIVASIKAKKK